MNLLRLFRRKQRSVQADLLQYFRLCVDSQASLPKRVTMSQPDYWSFISELESQQRMVLRTNADRGTILWEGTEIEPSDGLKAGEFVYQ